MKPAARFRESLETAAAAMQMVAGAVIFVTAVAVSLNALARYVLSRDIALVSEAGGFVFLIVIFLGLAGTFLAGSHVSIELLSVVAPARIARWVARILVPILSLLFVTALMVTSAIMTVRYFNTGRMTIGLFPMPFWIFMAVVPIGSLMLNLVLLSIIVDRLRGVDDDEDQPPKYSASGAPDGS